MLPPQSGHEQALTGISLPQAEHGAPRTTLKGLPANGGGVLSFLVGARKRRSASGPRNNPRTKYGHRPRLFFTPTSPQSIPDVKNDMSVDISDIIIIILLVSTGYPELRIGVSPNITIQITH